VITPRISSKAAALAAVILTGLVLHGCSSNCCNRCGDRFPNETTVWWPQPGAAAGAGNVQYSDDVISKTIGLRPELEHRSTLGTLPKVSLPGEFGGAFSLFTPDDCAAYTELAAAGLPAREQGMVSRGRLIQAPFALWPELEKEKKTPPSERIRVQSGTFIKVAGMLHVMQATSERVPLPDQPVSYGKTSLLYAPETCYFFLRTDDNRWLQPKEIILGETGWQTYWDEPAGKTSWKKLGKEHRIRRTFLPVTLLYDAAAIGADTKWVELHIVERKLLPDGLKDPQQASWTEERDIDASARARHLKGRWTIKRVPAQG